MFESENRSNKSPYRLRRRRKIRRWNNRQMEKCHPLKETYYCVTRNVDGTHNEMGKIRYKTKICYNMKRNQFEDWFYVTKLGDQKVILGLPWLKQVNPDIDWLTGTVSFPEE